WLDKYRDSKDLTVWKRIHTISALRGTEETESAGKRAPGNDLEEVVARHCPEGNAAKQLLVEQGLGPVRMSGSGSVVFGVLPRERSPHDVARALRLSPFDVVV